MKKLGKALMGLIAAVAMLFTGLVTSSTAFADETQYTITIDNAVAGYTYDAYQVFSGDLSDTTLSNIAWGSGIDAGKTPNLLTALKNDDAFKVGEKNIFADAATAADVANALGEATAAASYDSDIAKAFAKVVNGYLADTAAGTTNTLSDGKYQIENLDPGYYLVKNSQVPSGAYTYTDLILKVVKNVTVQPKGEVPTVEKKVMDKNDSETVDNDPNDNKWTDSADFDVNDDMSYRLDGTLPDNYDSYGTYKYVFTDTMSKGLKLKEAEDSTTEAPKYELKVYVVKNLGTATEVKNEITDGYTVQYEESGITNESDTYYQGHKLTVSFTNLKTATVANNGVIDKDTHIVVEYTAVLTADAIIGSAGNPNKVDLTFSNNPNGTGEGKTPEDKVTVFTFKVVVNKVDENSEALTGAGFTLQKLNATTGNYENVGAEQYSDGTLSTFTFERLDAGKYQLVESHTPAGYNTITPIQFEIVAEHEAEDEDPSLTKLVIKDKDGNVIGSSAETVANAAFTLDLSAGSATADVVNEKGSNLPSTGGMGTVILYVAGAACVIAAGVWFALRRRATR